MKKSELRKLIREAIKEQSGDKRPDVTPPNGDEIMKEFTNIANQINLDSEQRNILWDWIWKEFKDWIEDSIPGGEV